MEVVLRAQNQTVLDSLDEGDLIEFPRGWYSHWAVYIGNCQVVHRSGDNDGIKDGSREPGVCSSCSGVSIDKAKIKMDNFWHVVGDSMAKRNNKDGKHRPHPPSEIVKRAMSKVGEGGYNVIWKNCEHFAAWCRHGVEKSDQVDNFILGAGIGGVVGIGAAIWAASRKDNKK